MEPDVHLQKLPNRKLLYEIVRKKLPDVWDIVIIIILIIFQIDSAVERDMQAAVRQNSSTQETFLSALSLF